MRFCLAILLEIIKFIILPVQFKDRNMGVCKEDLESRIATTSSYLNDQFGDSKEFVFDVAPLISLPKELAYYGRNGEQDHDFNFYEAVIQACRESNDVVDFAQYDNDGDGKVDAVILLCAGESEADGESPDYIWPQHSMLKYKSIPISLDRTIIDSYVSLTETCRTGTWCHEMGHIFGLPDFYDTDGKSSGGISLGLWESTSLMDYGASNDKGETPPYLNAVERQLIGLGEDEELTPGHYNLNPVRSNRRLRADTATKDRYILLECRDNHSWDRFCGGRGMLAYLVDRSEPEMSKSWNENRVNCSPGKEGVSIICADKKAHECSQIFFPQPGRTSLSLMEYGIDLSLRNISITDEGNVDFDVIKPLETLTITSFQDAAIIEWGLDGSIAEGSRCILEWSSAESCPQHEETEGKAFTIEGLSPFERYDLKIEITDADGEIHLIKTNFRTKTKYHNSKPFIYLNMTERNDDGTFKKGSRLPLRIFNAGEYGKIEWFMDGRSIQTAEDGFYTINSGGELKAVIHYSDGSQYVIVKQINVR